MKDELKKILKESVWQMKNANEDFLDGYPYTPTFEEIQEDAINKILQLFNETIDSAYEEIVKKLLNNDDGAFAYSVRIRAITDYINTIKKGITNE